MNTPKYTRETIKQIDVTDRNFPDFKPGDTISISVKVIEGTKERIQDFEGTVLGLKGTGISKTFRVRKISEGVAVERIFPYFSPNIVNILIKREGKVRRAKLYYLRARKGKGLEVKKKVVSKKTAAKAPVVQEKQS